MKQFLSKMKNCWQTMKMPLYFLFVYFFIQVCATVPGAVINVVTELMGQPVQQIFLILEAQTFVGVLGVALFVIAKYCPVSTSYIRTKPLDVLLLSVVLALTAILPSVAFTEMLPDDMTKDNSQAVIVPMLASDYGFFIIGLLIPVFEEVVFRGAILRSLLERLANSSSNAGMGNDNAGGLAGKPWIAITISAIIFSAAHMNLAQMPHAFLSGLLLGWLYYRTGSILPAVVFHIVNNSSSFIMARCFPELPYDATLSEFFHGDDTMLVTSVAVSSVLFVATLWITAIRFAGKR